MLLIIQQLNLRSFQLNIYPIRPPNGASGETESETESWLL